MKYNPLKIKQVLSEANNAVRIAFETTSINGEYTFKPGQYLTLKRTIAGKDIRRPYSLCSSPYANPPTLEIVVKKVSNGTMSTFLNDEAKEGDILDVQTPMGNFHISPHPANEKEYIFFAAGSGITPILSIIYSVLLEEPKSNVMLFYGNKRTDTTILKQRIDELAEVYGKRFTLHYIYSQQKTREGLFHGRIDKHKTEQLYAQFLKTIKDPEFFICGPGNMIDAVKEVLQARGVHKKNIHIEYFREDADNKDKAPVEKPNVEASVTVILDDEAYSFSLNARGKSVLEAATEKGIDVPFACKGGVCCTCKAQIMEGKVTMDKNYALEEEDIDKGYILTCQSHPVSKKLVITFDV